MPQHVVPLRRRALARWCHGATQSHNTHVEGRMKDVQHSEGQPMNVTGKQDDRHHSQTRIKANHELNGRKDSRQTHTQSTCHETLDTNVVTDRRTKQRQSKDGVNTQRATIASVGLVPIETIPTKNTLRNVKMLVPHARSYSR